MNEILLLDEHYFDASAAQLLAAGRDVLAVVADLELRAQSDPEVFRRAAASGRRVVARTIVIEDGLRLQLRTDRGELWSIHRGTDLRAGDDVMVSIDGGAQFPG